MTFRVSDLQQGTLVHSKTPISDVMNGKLGCSRSKTIKSSRKKHGEIDQRPKWENYEDIDLEYDEDSYDSDGELLPRQPPKGNKLDESTKQQLKNLLRAQRRRVIAVEEKLSETASSSTESSSTESRKRKSVFSIAHRNESTTVPEDTKVSSRQKRARKQKERQDKEKLVEANSILRSMAFTLRTEGTHNGFSKRICIPGTETYKLLMETAAKHRHNWSDSYEPYGGTSEKPSCLSYEHTKIAPYLAKFVIGNDAPELVQTLSDQCKDVLVPLPESTEYFRLQGNAFKAHSFWLPSNDGDYKFYVVFMEYPPDKKHIFMDFFYVNLRHHSNSSASSSYSR